MTPIRRERFSTVDAAWLHMDEPTNMAMITGVMTFAAPIAAIYENLDGQVQHARRYYNPALERP